MSIAIKNPSVSKNSRLLVISVVALAGVLITAAVLWNNTRARLDVRMGPSGLERITFGGFVLTDTSKQPADSFHIGHMRVTNLQGEPLKGAADGWGENSITKNWDAAAHSWTYQFAWGNIRSTYVQTGDTLNVTVVETNRPDSGVILSGAVVYPLTLHFPSTPSGFSTVPAPQIEFNTTGPSVTQAKFGEVQAVSVVADGSKPLYSGFWPTHFQTTAYDFMVASTEPDGLATFQPHFDRPVKPGESDTFTVSLRFAKATSKLSTIAADAYQNWARDKPVQLKWSDRRIIGTAYLATAPAAQGAAMDARNPRRYLSTAKDPDFDVRTAEGAVAFQERILQRATDVVANLRRLNAQGVITWDLEGQQYPHSVSYVCSPDQIASVSPEMESTVNLPASPYLGLRLDDAYFKTITSAGFRVGVCVRPQRFVKHSEDSAEQLQLTSAEAEAELQKKIQYAHDRWGATLFYIDSTLEQNGAVLSTDIFKRLAARFSDSLLIPEQSNPSYYAYVAPFKTFLFRGDLGTEESVRDLYKSAFSCNLVNDVNPDTLESYTKQLTLSVSRGDILMTHADYWQQNNASLVAIYEAAQGGGR